MLSSKILQLIDSLECGLEVLGGDDCVIAHVTEMLMSLPKFFLNVAISMNDMGKIDHGSQDPTYPDEYKDFICFT